MERSVLRTERKQAWDAVKAHLRAGRGEVCFVHQAKFGGDQTLSS